MKYYLCGPYNENKACKEFFDNFMDGCDANVLSTHSTRSCVITANTYRDLVFLPWEYSLNYDEVKKKFNKSGLERAIKLNLELRTENLRDSMVVFSNNGFIFNQDSMFELGYYLATKIGGLGSSSTHVIWSSIKKNIIFSQDNYLLIKSINKLSKWANVICNKYNPESTDILNSTGTAILSDSAKKSEFSIVSICIDDMNSPFNFMLAGLLYGLDIPYVTYSNSKSTPCISIMASNLGHIDLNGCKKLNTAIKSRVSSFLK